MSHVLVFWALGSNSCVFSVWDSFGSTASSFKLKTGAFFLFIRLVFVAHLLVGKAFFEISTVTTHNVLALPLFPLETAEFLLRRRSSHRGNVELLNSHSSNSKSSLLGNSYFTPCPLYWVGLKWPLGRLQ